MLCMCGISELKSQIWEAEIANLDGICNILVFTHFPRVSNDVWMVFINFLMVFSDFSVDSEHVVSRGTSVLVRIVSMDVVIASA